MRKRKLKKEREFVEFIFKKFFWTRFRSNIFKKRVNLVKNHFLHIFCTNLMFISICAAEFISELEHLTGIEPAYQAWEASVLPLNYRCIAHIIG